MQKPSHVHEVNCQQYLFHYDPDLFLFEFPVFLPLLLFHELR